MIALRRSRRHSFSTPKCSSVGCALDGIVAARSAYSFESRAHMTGAPEELTYAPPFSGKMTRRARAPKTPVLALDQSTACSSVGDRTRRMLANSKVTAMSRLEPQQLPVRLAPLRAHAEQLLQPRLHRVGKVRVDDRRAGEAHAERVHRRSPLPHLEMEMRARRET